MTHPPGKDALQVMIHRKLIVGLDDVPDSPEDFDCEACVCGKMTRAPFQKGHNTAKEHLGCLHSDVCGLMEMTSLGKRHYFCTLGRQQDRVHMVPPMHVEI